MLRIYSKVWLFEKLQNFKFAQMLNLRSEIRSKLRKWQPFHKPSLPKFTFKNWVPKRVFYIKFVENTSSNCQEKVINFQLNFLTSKIYENWCPSLCFYSCGQFVKFFMSIDYVFLCFPSFILMVKKLFWVWVMNNSFNK